MAAIIRQPLAEGKGEAVRFRMKEAGEQIASQRKQRGLLMGDPFLSVTIEKRLYHFPNGLWRVQ